MSVHVSSLVYRRKFGSAQRKAVALKLADHAGDDGSRIFPGVATIAAEAEVSERTVQRVLKAFVEEGLLIVVRRGGRGPTDATEYRLDLEAVSALPPTKGVRETSLNGSGRKGDSMTPIAIPKGDCGSKKGDTRSRKGDWVTPEPSLTVKEPSESTHPREVPHFDANGELIISGKHGLTIASDKIEGWRKQYTSLPDFDAKVIALATVILAKGRMHPGWTCPEGWMASPLAKDNAEAKQEQRVADARVQRVSGAPAQKRSGIPPAEQGEKAQRIIDAGEDDWNERINGPGPHKPDCWFTEPGPRACLMAVYNEQNRRIRQPVKSSALRAFSGATHPAAGAEVPF